MPNHLKSIFEDSDYSQHLRLFYNDTLVFYGVADDLVTSSNGELQIYLNFSKTKKFLHTLRIFGKFIVLIPKISDGDSTTYMKISKKISLVFIGYD